MTDDNHAHQDPAAQAVDAVRRLGRDGIALCPEGVHPDRWADQVLDELARAAELMGRAVGEVSGERHDATERSARALATVISAHRDNLLRGRLDRAGSPATGAAAVP